MRRHYFRMFFLLSSFDSFNSKHRAEENVIIMGPKKKKLKKKVKRNLRNQKMVNAGRGLWLSMLDGCC